MTFLDIHKLYMDSSLSSLKSLKSSYFRLSTQLSNSLFSSMFRTFEAFVPLVMLCFLLDYYFLPVKIPFTVKGHIEQHLRIWTLVPLPFSSVTLNGFFFFFNHFYAKVGSQEIPGVTCKFGLGIRNEAGQRLIEFCQENALVITKTLFQQHKRRLYTWTSPDGQH